MARWEQEDPLTAIDAQIEVMTKARAESTAELISAEQDVVAAMATHDTAGEATARQRVIGARTCVRDFSAELDELRTERGQMVPRPRWPASAS